jgi:hypothetical protein
MCEPEHLATLLASKACYKDTFTLAFIAKQQKYAFLPQTRGKQEEIDTCISHWNLNESYDYCTNAQPSWN